MKALHRSRIDRVSIAPYSPGKGEKEKKGNRGRKRDADRLDWFESETAVALVAQQPHKGGQKWHDGAFTRALFAGTIAYRYTRARSSRKLQPIARKRAHARSEKEREREREREGGKKEKSNIQMLLFPPLVGKFTRLLTDSCPSREPSRVDGDPRGRNVKFVEFGEAVIGRALLPRSYLQRKEKATCYCCEGCLAMANNVKSARYAAIATTSANPSQARGWHECRHACSRFGTCGASRAVGLAERVFSRNRDIVSSSRRVYLSHFADARGEYTADLAAYARLCFGFVLPTARLGGVLRGYF